MTGLTTSAVALPTGRRIRAAALWIVQAALAAQFAVGGALKVSGDPTMVDMFADIGAGQWFRFVVGALEIAGALGLLVPRLAGLAALGLVGLMAGAIVTNIAVLATSPVPPLAFLLFSSVVVWTRREQVRTSSPHTFGDRTPPCSARPAIRIQLGGLS